MFLHTFILITHLFNSQFHNFKASITHLADTKKDHFESIISSLLIIKINYLLLYFLPYCSCSEVYHIIFIFLSQINNIADISAGGGGGVIGGGVAGRGSNGRTNKLTGRRDYIFCGRGKRKLIN